MTRCTLLAQPRLNQYLLPITSGGGVFGLLVLHGQNVVKRDDWNIGIVMKRNSPWWTLTIGHI